MSADSLAWAAQELGVAKVAASTLSRATEALIDRGLVMRDPLGAGPRLAVSDPVMRAWMTRNIKLPVRTGSGSNREAARTAASAVGRSPTRAAGLQHESGS